MILLWLCALLLADLELPALYHCSVNSSASANIAITSPAERDCVSTTRLQFSTNRGPRLPYISSRNTLITPTCAGPASRRLAYFYPLPLQPLLRRTVQKASAGRQEAPTLPAQPPPAPTSHPDGHSPRGERQSPPGSRPAPDLVCLVEHGSLDMVRHYAQVAQVDVE